MTDRFFPRARIDTAALAHNLEVVRRAAPAARVMAVIKANAYGHGAVPVARALGNVDAFAVARIDEAVELRAAGIRQPLLLLEGVFDAAQWQQARQLELDLVLHDASQLLLLRSLSQPFAGKLWVKVDTGMNRLGFRPEDLPALWAELGQHVAQRTQLHLMTHLARADEPEHLQTHTQLQRFDAVRRLLGDGVSTSIGNSAGIFNGPACHGDWVRPGIALYGVSPYLHRSAKELGLRPAMQFETVVIAVHEVAAGETVGYGGRWCAPRPSRIAILAAGYADGVPRHLRDGAAVLIGAQRVPVIGRVSMDMMAVDVTDLQPAVQTGAIARLWGEGLPVEEVAAAASTIGYELTTRIGRRVQLQYC